MMMSAFNQESKMYTASAACAEAFSGCAASRSSAMNYIVIIMDAVLASIFVALISVIVRNVVVISILGSIILVSIIVVSIILITDINSNTPRYRGHA